MAVLCIEGMLQLLDILLPPTDTIVGVNKYTLDKEEQVDVLSIDNAKTIETQVRGVIPIYSSPPLFGQTNSGCK